MKKPPWEPRYDDPRDQRVAEIIKEAFEHYEPSVDQLPIKELRSKILVPRELDPEMLDRNYLEVRAASEERKIDYGSGSVTVPFGTTAAAGSFSHRLGKPPVGISIQCATAPFGSFVGQTYTLNGWDKDQVTFTAHNWNGYNGGVVALISYIVVA